MAEVITLCSILDLPIEERQKRLTQIGMTEAEYRAELEASIAEILMDYESGPGIEQSDKFNQPIVFEIVEP